MWLLPAEATDVQQSTRADNRSLSQSNALVRALTTYTTSQQSVLKRIINAKRAFNTWDMQSKEQKKQAVWDMIYYPTFGNFIFQSVSTGYIMSILNDEDDEGDPEVTKKKTSRFFLEHCSVSSSGFWTTRKAC